MSRLMLKNDIDIDILVDIVTGIVIDKPDINIYLSYPTVNKHEIWNKKKKNQDTSSFNNNNVHIVPYLCVFKHYAMKITHHM